MLDAVFGVPTHVLVVHAVVVLVPLAALGGVAVALVPALRRRYGPLVVLLTVVAVSAVPVATRSGDRLFARQSARFGPADVTEAGLMEEHRELGGDLLPWTLLLLAGVLLAVVPPLVARAQRTSGAPDFPPAAPGQPATATAVQRRAPQAPPGWARPVALLAAAVTVAAAVLSLVLVIRIGHSGAEATWERLNRPAAGLVAPGR